MQGFSEHNDLTSKQI